MNKEGEICSVVIPVFNEEENLELLHRRLSKVLQHSCEDYEIILVDDGSRDNSLQAMMRLRESNP
ncbi:unnamed protein product, partial [marine sediment metagenome]